MGTEELERMTVEELTGLLGEVQRIRQSKMDDWLAAVRSQASALGLEMEIRPRRPMGPAQADGPPRKKPFKTRVRRNLVARTSMLNFEGTLKIDANRVAVERAIVKVLERRHPLSSRELCSELGIDPKDATLRTAVIKCARRMAQDGEIEWETTRNGAGNYRQFLFSPPMPTKSRAAG